MNNVSPEIKVTPAGPERLDDIKPLWQALLDHHAFIAPETGIVRPMEESWSRRRACYEAWLKEEGSFLLLAQIEDRLVGYAFVRIGPAPATWQTADRIAELETLSILPRFRNRGVGKVLMEEVYSRLKQAGFRELMATVVSTNTGAIRFYESQGFNPRTVTLWRHL